MAFLESQNFQQNRTQNTNTLYRITLRKNGEYRIVFQRGESRLDAQFRAEASNPEWLSVIVNEVSKYV